MNIGEGLAKVRRDCLPFLAMIEPSAAGLYRGCFRDGAAVFEDEVFRDRKPKNMPVELHQAADAWFSARFGVRYRGAGLFCTGDAVQAASHGDVYRIYPVGGFQFCWSPRVKDLHAWCDENGFLEKSPDALTNALAGLDYREDDLAEALASGSEIMVACKCYVSILSPDRHCT